MRACERPCRRRRSAATFIASKANSRHTAISTPSPARARMVLASMSTTASATVPSAVTSAIAWRHRISFWVGDRKPVT